MKNIKLINLKMSLIYNQIRLIGHKAEGSAALVDLRERIKAFKQEVNFIKREIKLLYIRYDERIRLIKDNNDLITELNEALKKDISTREKLVKSYEDAIKALKRQLNKAEQKEAKAKVLMVEEEGLQAEEEQLSVKEGLQAEEGLQVQAGVQTAGIGNIENDKNINKGTPIYLGKNNESNPAYEKMLNKMVEEDILRKYNVSLKDGYQGYTSSYYLDYYEDITIDELAQQLSQFLGSLPKDNVYTALPVIEGINDEGYRIYRAVSNSIKLSSDMDAINLAYFLHSKIAFLNAEYGYDSYSGLLIQYKLWVSAQEIKSSRKKAIEILNEQIKLELVGNKLKYDLDGHQIIISKSFGLDYISKLKRNCVTSLAFDAELLDYMTIYSNDYNNSGNDPELSERLYQFERRDLTLKIQRVSKAVYYVSVYKKSVEIIQWTDHVSNDTITRKLGPLTLKISGGQVDPLLELDMPTMRQEAQSPYFDNNIGTIDLETCSDSKDPSVQVVYGAAYAAGDNVETYWLEDQGLDGQAIICQMITDIMQSKYCKSTFYVHNLSRFDGHFFVKALIQGGFKIKPVMKDNNTIISLVISKKFKSPRGSERTHYLKIYDSFLLLKDSLRNLAVNFEVPLQKTEFPHKFASLDNLNYIGVTPARTYYRDDITKNEYALQIKDQWDFKAESLNYLRNDVLALLQVLQKFAREIHNLYDVNITNYKTLPSLALGIFLSNFYDKTNKPIKVIKGAIERNIREAYFGGIAEVHSHKITNGYMYDINSAYPAAMLEDLPTGNPRYSTKKDLQNIFGFVRARVTTPSVLRVPILPIKTLTGLIKPRGTFVGNWFSEELKYAVTQGYTVEVLSCIEFDRTPGIFKEYVNNLYAQKCASNNNPSRRATAKLLLNSLYGRMGMNEILSKVKIVSSDKVAELERTSRWSSIADLGKHSIVRTSGLINHDLLKLIDHPEQLSPGLQPKLRGVISSVSIAAAITAYARILLNKFINIPNNPCQYADTDCVVLPHKLPPELVGKGLGQMKLEYEIKTGIFISPKTYALKVVDQKIGLEREVLKCKGVGSKLMTWDMYEKLLAGENVIINKVYFRPNLELGTVCIITKPYTIKGLVIQSSESKKVLALPAPRLLLALPAPNGKVTQTIVATHTKRTISTRSNIDKTRRVGEIIEQIKDTDSFKVAFTHKSCRNKNSALKSYENLEFLGDSLLQLFVSLFLYYSFPDHSEGDLTKLRTSMVEGKNLASLSLKIGLEKYLKIDKEVNFTANDLSKKNKKILVDIFESFVAALYLEKGKVTLHEFLSLTLFDRDEIRDKLKDYQLITPTKSFIKTSATSEGEAKTGTQIISLLEINESLYKNLVSLKEIYETSEKITRANLTIKNIIETYKRELDKYLKEKQVTSLLSANRETETRHMSNIETVILISAAMISLSIIASACLIFH